MEHSSEIVFLKSKRVVLRPVCETDIPLVTRWINDPDVRAFLAAHMPMNETDEKAWYEGLRARKPDDLVLTIVVDAVPIGTMGVHRIDRRNRLATTGAMIGEKSYWGKGFGSDAKMLLLDYLFNTLNLRKIYSHVISSNGRSRRYSEKCGYKVEAVLKKHHMRGARYFDELVLAVFRHDWVPLWRVWKKSNM